MRKEMFATAGFLVLGGFWAIQAAAVQSGTEYGTIQGIVTRAGSSEPLADVQITVNGAGASALFSDLLGPDATPQQTQALAQALLDESKRGAQVPAEILVAAQEAVQGALVADGKKQSAALKATTDAGGRFRIENVPAGTASVNAQLKGYFAPPAQGAYATAVEKGAEVEARKTTEVRIEMVSGGTISGRVYNAAGRAMTDVPIQVLRPGYSEGQSSLHLADVRLTDDRGEFRSTRIPPGDYYVLANPRRGASSVASEPTEIPIATLYPDALDVHAALAVGLHAGEEISNINIRVRNARAAKISGRVVTTLPAGPVTGQRGQTRPWTAAMALVQRGALGVSGVEGVVLNARPAITAKPEDSTFEIANVPPGTYDLFARLPVAATAGWGTSFPPARATAPWAIGRTSVEVNGSDVEGINIVVNPGVDLKGRLIVDGKPAQGAVGISLVPDTAASNVTDGQMSSVYGQIAQFAPSIEPDGSFVFPLLPEGPYRFQTTFAPTRQTRGQVAASAPSAATLPEMAYVADIRQSGQSVYEKGILVGKSEPNPIDVIVNTNGGGLEGIVTDNDGKTMSRMIVVLVPGSERRSNIEFYQTATTDAAGRFRISRIPPGQHTLFASRNIQIGTFQNATTFEKYARYGTGVNVSTGPLSSIVIKAIPNE